MATQTHVPAFSLFPRKTLPAKKQTKMLSYRDFILTRSQQTRQRHTRNLRTRAKKRNKMTQQFSPQHSQPCKLSLYLHDAPEITLQMRIVNSRSIEGDLVLASQRIWVSVFIHDDKPFRIHSARSLEVRYRENSENSRWIAQDADATPTTSVRGIWPASHLFDDSVKVRTDVFPLCGYSNGAIILTFSEADPASQDHKQELLMSAALVVDVPRADRLLDFAYQCWLERKSNSINYESSDEDSLSNGSSTDSGD